MSFDLSSISLDGSASSEALRHCFKEHGIVLLRGLLPETRIQAWRDQILQLITARVRALGGNVPAGADMDEALIVLMGLVDNGGMDIIRVVKDLPLFFQTLSDPGILRVVGACLGTEMLQAVHDIAQFRIDPPEYYVRNFGWHQDYQYNVTSLEAAVVWFPLTDIDENMGPLHIVPDSHRELLPVEYDASGHVPGKGTTHSVFRLCVDAQDMERRCVPLTGIRPGDVAVFDSLLVHRSGINTGPRARWVVNPRFGKLLDPSVVERGWLTMRDRTPDAFMRVHPDMARNAPAS